MMQAALAALLVLVMSGCAAPPPAAPTGNETTLDDAVNAATDSMVAQTQKMPAFLAKVESKLVKRGIVVDPMIDTGTGQQTALTQLLERKVTERFGARY